MSEAQIIIRIAYISENYIHPNQVNYPSTLVHSTELFAFLKKQIRRGIFHFLKFRQYYIWFPIDFQIILYLFSILLVYIHESYSYTYMIHENIYHPLFNQLTIVFDLAEVCSGRFQIAF